ncbi:MAG TPA: DUF3418 domain-containing protein, partial [Microthrixaceae bacterium]|nr:DUF3418 domain-containing protein [Microthrixaceae bacterium]
SFRIVDSDGVELAAGKDLRVLAHEVRQHADEVATQVDSGLERSGIRTWDLGELPRVVQRHVGGRLLKAYPALADDGDSVAVVACPSAEEQAAMMWEGTRRLLRLQMPSPARQVDSLLDERTKSLMTTGAIASKVEWYNDIIATTLDRLLADAGGPAWNEPAWARLVADARNGFHDALVLSCAAASRIIAAHRDIRAAMASSVSEAVDPAMVDIAEQLDRLLYPGVLTAVGYDRLDDIERYLRAVLRRLDALPNNVRRDAELMQRCRALESDYDSLLATVPMSDDVEAVGWMLEEFRVSSFAQQLRTSVPVSEKRIRNEIHRLARGL